MQLDEQLKPRNLMLNDIAYNNFVVKPARNEVEFKELGALYREYAGWLRIDANFPHLEDEIVGFPGEYAPPTGELLLALDRSLGAIGCVAVRPLQDSESCEMKRLYVRRTSRSRGVGHALAEAAVSFAVSAGYCHMLLDTLPSMRAAVAIYRSLGFEETTPYFLSPGPGALYLHKVLDTHNHP